MRTRRWIDVDLRTMGRRECLPQLRKLYVGFLFVLAFQLQFQVHAATWVGDENSQSAAAWLDADGGGASTMMSTLVCRITVENIRLTNGSSHELAQCVPIHNGMEEDRFLPINLEESVLLTNRQLILEGRFTVQLSNVTLHPSDHRMELKNQSDVRVLSSMEAAGIYGKGKSKHLRGQRRRDLAPIPPAEGNKTIAIVRISGPGSPNRFPMARLRKVWFGSDRSFQSQMTACSFGLLNWESAGVFDVRLEQNASAFASREEMQLTVERQLRNQTGRYITDIADKIVFCYPKTSPGGWLATASLHGWRAMFNDGWCGSLSAAMHEIGHTIGLSHSGKGETGNWEYSDTTGYMGYSVLSSSTPHKCYNGGNHWQLGWYPGRRRAVEMEPAVIRLAAFVDYKIAAPNEPVLVKVTNNLFLQYNRAKSFNSETPLYPDRVTVTRMRLDGRSENMAGLAEGETFWTRTNATIKACAAVTGKQGKDIMIVSIAGAPCP